MIIEDGCFADCFRRTQRHRFLAEKKRCGLCFICHIPRAIHRKLCGKDLAVHHLTYIREGHELSDDFAILCDVDHKDIEKRKLDIHGSARADSFDLLEEMEKEVAPIRDDLWWNRGLRSITSSGYRLYDLCSMDYEKRWELIWRYILLWRHVHPARKPIETWIQ